jgi:hypothetical protein
MSDEWVSLSKPKGSDSEWVSLSTPKGVGEDYRRSTGDAAKEVGRQLVGGVVSDLPKMAGQGLRKLGFEETGGALQEYGESKAADYKPNNIGAGVVGETLSMGARAVGPMAPAIAAGVAGGPMAAGMVGGAFFGTSAAQGTEDKLIGEGVDPAEARSAGNMTGLVQGPLEGVATAVGAKMFAGPARALMGGNTMGAVVNRATDAAVLKPLAKGMALNMLVQPTTEVIQDVGTELIERSYGAKPTDIGQIAGDSAQGAVGLTALLGPFAAGAQMSRAKHARAMDAALNDPSAPAAATARAEQIIVQQALESGVPAADVEAWQANRAQERASRPVVPAAPQANMMAGGTPAQVDAAETENTAIANAPPPPAPVVQSPDVNPALAAPEAGVAPEVLQQQENQAAQQNQQEISISEQQSKVNAVKEQIAARQKRTAEAEDWLGGAERDEKGKRVVKVPTRYSDAYLEMEDLFIGEKMDAAAFEDKRTRMTAALQMNDNKEFQAIRKEVEAIKNPPPPIVEKPKPVAKVAAPKAEPVVKSLKPPTTPVKEKVVAPLKEVEKPGPVTIIKPAPTPTPAPVTSPATVQKPTVKESAPPAPAPAISAPGPSRIEKELAELADPKNARTSVTIAANEEIPESLLNAQTSRRDKSGLVVAAPDAKGNVTVTAVSKTEAPAPAVSETAAPVAVPAPKGYAHYEGREVSVPVPGTKFKRAIKAKPALEEADDQIDKHEELVRCLSR